MSFGTFGYMLPIQISIVKLVMIDPSIFPRTRSDETLREQVSNGRNGLVHRTGVDLGFDLRAWHQHLMSDPELEQQYRWGDRDDFVFHKRILAEADNPCRNRIVLSLLNTEPAA